jgi:hypothetical protein
MAATRKFFAEEPSATLWFIRTFGDTAHLLANPPICC